MEMTNNLIISLLREVKLIIQFPVPLIHQLDLVEEGELTFYRIGQDCLMSLRRERL
jgi:hypothetical protein